MRTPSGTHLYPSLSWVLVGFFCLLSAWPALASTEVALTFDDLPIVGQYSRGESPLKVIHRILGVLKTHRISGVTAFVNMEKLGWSPDGAKVLKEWTDAGHLVANHTWSHPDLHRVSAQKYILEIEKNDQLLTTGFKNEFIRLFRYPFLHEGETLEKRNLVREALKSTGYQIAQVTVDFNDYLWNEPYLRCLKIRNSSKLQWLEKTFLSESAENLRGAEILARLLFDHPIKQIALVHPFELDSMKLDQMLTEWARTGVKFIPLRDAMKDPIYQINPNIAGANWTFLNQIRIARKIENSPELSQIYDHSARLAVELSKTCR